MWLGCLVQDMECFATNDCSPRSMSSNHRTCKQKAEHFLPKEYFFGVSFGNSFVQCTVYIFQFFRSVFELCLLAESITATTQIPLQKIRTWQHMATASPASAEGQDVLKKDATYNFGLIQISETAMRILQGRLALFVSGAPKFDTLNLGVQLAD